MSVKPDQRHLHLQVIDRLKKRIEEGTYREKERLPSEFDLAKDLGVSRATLREALRVLEEENFIIRRHGVGTFVAPKPLLNSGIEELHSVTSMIRNAGLRPGTIFLNSSEIGSTEEDKNRFMITDQDELLLVERVLTANGEPIVYCLDKIPKYILKEPFALNQDSIFNLIEEKAKCKIAYAVSEIEPVGYHEKISPLLNCEPEIALLLLKQLHYDEEERPVLYSVNYFRADAFRFQVVRRRDLYGGLNNLKKQ
ncbi:GntR family transcriptional regulator [Bacillus litorisediminis]|uniref:GntR family transcriptional regulator n=1 Tax=Bacillus litorisediminis TaxID=2922713 RepID=UPI001FAEBE8C|nr:GntR family transcriptional regulator [Bacillus litorisediminis]